jgi:hypothetical protein
MGPSAVCVAALEAHFSPCRKAHDKKIAEAEEGGASASEEDAHRQPLKEAELSNGNAVKA